MGGAGAAVAETADARGAGQQSRGGARKAAARMQAKLSSRPRGCGRSSAASRGRGRGWSSGGADTRPRRRGGAQSRPNSVRHPVSRLFIPLKKINRWIANEWHQTGGKLPVTYLLGQSVPGEGTAALRKKCTDNQFQILIRFIENNFNIRISNKVYYKNILYD